MANTAKSRAAAERAIRAYQPGRKAVADNFEADPETAICDLIADLLHLANDRFNLAADPIIDRALDYFNTEQQHAAAHVAYRGNV